MVATILVTQVGGRRRKRKKRGEKKEDRSSLGLVKNAKGVMTLPLCKGGGGGLQMKSKTTGKKSLFKEECGGGESVFSIHTINWSKENGKTKAKIRIWEGTSGLLGGSKKEGVRSET